MARFYSLNAPKIPEQGSKTLGAATFPLRLGRNLKLAPMTPFAGDIHTLLGTSNHVLTATAADAALPLLQCVQKPGAHR